MTGAVFRGRTIRACLMEIFFSILFFYSSCPQVSGKSKLFSTLSFARLPVTFASSRIGGVLSDMTI